MENRPRILLQYLFTKAKFLEQAMQIYPQTKRLLFTAYADTEAAVSAINKAKIDYYLLKPWSHHTNY